MESVCTQSAVQFSTQAPVGEIQVTALTATGNSAYMTIDRFDVTPTTIGNDRPTTISWGLKFKTPAARYTAEFHLNNGQQLQALSGRTRMFEDNGAIDTGMTGTDVSSIATIVCTRQTDQTGTLLNCGSHASAYIPADLTMPVYGILKACVDDADNRPVCAQKPLQLTFP